MPNFPEIVFSNIFLDPLSGKIIIKIPMLGNTFIFTESNGEGEQKSARDWFFSPEELKWLAGMHDHARNEN